MAAAKAIPPAMPVTLNTTRARTPAPGAPGAPTPTACRATGCAPQRGHREPDQHGTAQQRAVAVGQFQQSHPTGPDPDQGRRRHGQCGDRQHRQRHGSQQRALEEVRPDRRRRVAGFGHHLEHAVGGGADRQGGRAHCPQSASGPGHGPGEQHGEQAVGADDVPAVEQDDVDDAEHDQPGSAPADQPPCPRRVPVGVRVAPGQLHQAVPEEYSEQRRRASVDQRRQQPLDGDVEPSAAGGSGEVVAPCVQHPGVGERDEQQHHPSGQIRGEQAFRVRCRRSGLADGLSIWGHGVDAGNTAPCRTSIERPGAPDQSRVGEVRAARLWAAAPRCPRGTARSR